MRKQYPRTRENPHASEFLLMMAPIFNMSFHYMGILPVRDGRIRSRHRHRNSGRAA